MSFLLTVPTRKILNLSLFISYHLLFFPGKWIYELALKPTLKVTHENVHQPVHIHTCTFMPQHFYFSLMFLLPLP